MNELLQQLIPFVDNHGFPWVITLIVVGFMSVYWYRKLKPHNITSQQNPLFDCNLQSHSILTTLEIFTSVTIQAWSFKNDFKQLLWTDFLTAYFQAMKKYIEDGLLRKFETLPHTRFQSDVTTWLTGLLPYCEEAARKEIAQHLSSPDTDRPADVILQKFHTIDRHYYMVFLAMVGELTETHYLTNNTQRMAAILFTLKGYLTILIKQSESTFDSLNGELQGLTYKGISNKNNP